MGEGGSSFTSSAARSPQSWTPAIFRAVFSPLGGSLPAEPSREEMSPRDPETSDCLGLLLIKVNLGVSRVTALVLITVAGGRAPVHDCVEWC